MDLSDIDRKQFPKIRNRRTKKSYLRMEYEVRVSFDYPRLTYEVIIPRNGVFPDAESLGNDPIRKPAVLNCAAAVDVARPQTLKTPEPSRFRLSSPISGGNVAGVASLTRSNPRPKRARVKKRRHESPVRQKSCQRCCRLKSGCIRAAFGNPCYKCIRAGEECINRP